MENRKIGIMFIRVVKEEMIFEYFGQICWEYKMYSLNPFFCLINL